MDELKYANKSTRTTFNAKVKNILFNLEKESDLKAIKKIGDFTNSVDEMKAEGRLDSYQAKYLIHEAKSILKTCSDSALTKLPVLQATLFLDSQNKVCFPKLNFLRVKICRFSSFLKIRRVLISSFQSLFSSSV